ncbi:acyl-CoA dehydrogenase family protein [Sphingopyxis sp. PET50]|uniref:acyl-CoA dehydrogenase family protein n=1 Tax=Sphingopyxis sp. PET50 TaxID=2976533 RepID=UPI0021AE7A9E|nr:acyl-CoA dehydrogenase family protein [Sphingopyxis sp. PET50]
MPGIAQKTDFGTGDLSDLTPAGVEAAIRMLSDEFAATGEKTELERQPPQQLFDKLAATGVFRMLWPREFGGGGFRLPDALPVIETLASLDGSAGWSTMIGVESAALWTRFEPGIATAHTPEYGVLTRASLIPRGVAVETSDGWHLKGHWPLASGAYDADWFIAAAMVKDGDAIRMLPNGLPDARIFAVPPDRVEIRDTWRALGLRSTMSHDILIDTVLPAHHAAPAAGTGLPGSPWPLGRLPTWMALGPFHCAVIIGIVRGALGDVIELLPTKRPVLNPTIRTCEDPLVQHSVGAAATRLDAARAFLMTEANASWAMAEDGDVFAPRDRIRFRSMLSHVHAECVTIMDVLFSLVGANPLYDGSALQRRYRDLRAACQHVTASPEVFRPYGAMLMDVPVPNEAAL